MSGVDIVNIDQQAKIRELEKKVEMLSGKTGFCAQCEAYAKKLERHEKALKRIPCMCPIISQAMKRDLPIDYPDNHIQQCPYNIAKEALEGGEG